MNDEHALVVENLTKVFRRHLAVDHLTFHVARGRLFGFLGPNGAGKGTTISGCSPSCCDPRRETRSSRASA